MVFSFSLRSNAKYDSHAQIEVIDSSQGTVTNNLLLIGFNLKLF